MSLTVDETATCEADANFLFVYHLIGLEIGQRHSTILLKHHLSSIAVCGQIKPDIFDINRDMPTGRATPSLLPLERVDSGADGTHMAPFSVSISYIKSA